MVKAIACVALGGSLGALARWALQRWIDFHWGADAAFPWGILVVNVAGCFLFGWLFAVFENRAQFSDAVQLAIFTGFLGSFTTFSTFGWNTLELVRAGHAGLAFANVGASVGLGLVAVWAGIALGK